MKKSSKIYSAIKVFVLIFYCGFGSPIYGASDISSIVEMHPPILIAEGQQKSLVFFLRSNLNSKGGGAYLAGTEVFYYALSSSKPMFNHVLTVRGEKILSVFFYDWKKPNRLGRSMYVLTVSEFLDSEFEGVEYSATELSILKENNSFSVLFFPGDLSDPMLTSCIEGRSLVSGGLISCNYKDAASIKKYLAALDD